MGNLSAIIAELDNQNAKPSNAALCSFLSLALSHHLYSAEVLEDSLLLCLWLVLLAARFAASSLYQTKSFSAPWAASETSGSSPELLPLRRLNLQQIQSQAWYSRAWARPSPCWVGYAFRRLFCGKESFLPARRFRFQLPNMYPFSLIQPPVGLSRGRMQGN